MRTSAKSKFPSVSVIIPVYNEEKRISDTLQALLLQTYPKSKFSIVVVDNGSTDRTKQMVSKFPVILVEEPQRSSYAARNHGIKITQSDYVAFIDSDCIPKPEWLENLVLLEQNNGCGLVAGRTELAPLQKHQTMGSFLLQSRFSAQKRRHWIEKHALAAAGNLLVRRQVFNELGLFRIAVSGSDTQFTHFAAENGWRVLYAPNAAVWHPSDISNFQFLKRTFRLHYGRGSAWRKKDKDALSIFYKIPWRPPFRLPSELLHQVSMKSVPLAHIAWSLFLWLDSISAWMGSVFGYLQIRYYGDRR